MPVPIFVPPAQPLPQQPGPALPTPVRIERLLPFLCGYDAQVVSFLKNGFTFGFPLHFSGPRVSFYAKNLASAYQNPEIVSAKLDKELQAHRIAGPFKAPPFPTFRVSPLGLVPKKTPGEFRLIHHLSFPPGTSVNDGILPEHATVTYSRVDDAICLIKRVGRGCFLAKTDIQSAFRIIPISPRDYDLLGMVWQGNFYYDRAMPMGCASSCRTFEMFSTALQWVSQNRLNIVHLIHILDDFLMAASSYDQCCVHLKNFLSLCDYVGVPIAPEKTVGPRTTLTFAGIELDTVMLEARLPADKIAKTQALLLSFLTHKKATLQEVQSLI